MQGFIFQIDGVSWELGCRTTRMTEPLQERPARAADLRAALAAHGYIMLSARECRESDETLKRLAAGAFFDTLQADIAHPLEECSADGLRAVFNAGLEVGLAEVADLRMRAPSVRSVPNADAGDFSEICSVCAAEVSAPHSARDCFERGKLDAEQDKAISAERCNERSSAQVPRELLTNLRAECQEQRNDFEKRKDCTHPVEGDEIRWRLWGYFASLLDQILERPDEIVKGRWVRAKHHHAPMLVTEINPDGWVCTKHGAYHPLDDKLELVPERDVIDYLVQELAAKGGASSTALEKLALGSPVVAALRSQASPPPQAAEPADPPSRSTDYAIGSRHCPGFSKLIEECGEVAQVLGKVMGLGSLGKHWDGSDLKMRLECEIGDLVAAVAFVVCKNQLDEEVIESRSEMKLELFEKWHQEGLARHE